MEELAALLLELSNLGLLGRDLGVDLLQSLGVFGSEPS
jgi:hypothetical protein